MLTFHCQHSNVKAQSMRVLCSWCRLIAKVLDSSCWLMTLHNLCKLSVKTGRYSGCQKSVTLYGN